MQDSESVPPRNASIAKSALEVVVMCALIAGVGAALSGAEPTGTAWWDPLLTGLFAGLFVLAASRASTVVLVAVAGLSAALVGMTPWLIAGLLAFALAIAAELRSPRRVELQAISGALTITALLHLRSMGFFGLSAALAGSAATAVFVSWYRHTNPVAKRRTRRLVGLVATILVVFGLIAAAIGLSVRTSANEGIAAARAGLSSARAGDPQELTTQLEIAADRLNHARGRIDSPVLQPLYLVPVAAQHLRALSTAATQGSAVASEAAVAVVEADLGELQLRQGQFDLGLLTTMAPRLASVAEELEVTIDQIAQVRSGWLVPFVDDNIQTLAVEVEDVLPEAKIAAEAAQVMPAILGAEQERRYLMLFGSPAESRQFGGFVGGYALIGVLDGSLDLIEAGSTNELRLLSRPDSLPNPDTYPIQYVEANPAFFPQNLTSTPDMAVILRATQEIFPQLAGAPIDGIIYADPFALGAFTELTGPIWVPSLDQPLVGADITNFIFEEQYRIFANRFDRDQRFAAIGALATATAAAFERADLPGPERLGQVLGPVARAGRLQVITTDDRENDFLASVLLQRNFVAPTLVDSLAVMQANATESKLDLYLHREVSYDVAVDSAGGLQATLDITLESVVPDDAAPLTFGETDGTNQVLLSVYSPHELRTLTVNGEPHEYAVHDEFGFSRYGLFKIELAPNSRAEVRLELDGTAPAGPYRLGVWAQPLVNRDSVNVTYGGPEGPAVTASQILEENWVFDPRSVGG